MVIIIEFQSIGAIPSALNEDFERSESSRQGLENQ